MTLSLRDLVVFVLVAAAILVFVGPVLGAEKEVKPSVDTTEITSRLLDILEKVGSKAVDIGERAADGAGKAASYAWPRLVLLVWVKALGMLVSLLLGIVVTVSVSVWAYKEFRVRQADLDHEVLGQRHRTLADAPVARDSEGVMIFGLAWGIAAVMSGVVLLINLPDIVGTLIAPDAVLMYELLQKIKP